MTCSAGGSRGGSLYSIFPKAKEELAVPRDVAGEDVLKAIAKAAETSDDAQEMLSPGVVRGNRPPIWKSPNKGRVVHRDHGHLKTRRNPMVWALAKPVHAFRKWELGGDQARARSLRHAEGDAGGDEDLAATLVLSQLEGAR